MFQEIETWGDLLKALSTLSEEDLKRPVQVGNPPPMPKPTRMQPGIAICTVEASGIEGSASVIDARYHGEELFLLVDYHPYGKDGAVSYKLAPISKRRMKKNKQRVKKGKRPRFHRKKDAVYGKHGKVERDEQMAPDRKRRSILDDHFEFTKTEAAIVNRRTRQFRKERGIDSNQKTIDLAETENQDG